MDRLPTGPFVFVLNHVSYLDPIVIGASFGLKRRVCFLEKYEQYKLPVVNQFSRFFRTIPIDKPGVDPLDIAQDRLSEGMGVGIFPEGTRAHDGKLGKGRPGAAFLAMAAGVPIVPVFIDGTFKALPRGRFFPKPVKVRVWFGTPFDLSDLDGWGDPKILKSRISSLKAGTKRIMEAIEELARNAHGSENG